MEYFLIIVCIKHGITVWNFPFVASGWCSRSFEFGNIWTFWMRDAHPAIPQSQTFLLEDCALPSQHLLGGDASQSLWVNEVPAHRQVFCAPTDEQAEGWQGPGPLGGASAWQQRSALNGKAWILHRQHQGAERSSARLHTCLRVVGSATYPCQFSPWSFGLEGLKCH